ncbi:hypothetical protein [Microbacterium sp.]|uniref:hypothetical protein n=1 Tax=Microbacterium sp. TaxID=51671 RepID=UPI0026061131|nr:hypothetical protein [Microbacterium sp.]
MNTQPTDTSPVSAPAAAVPAPIPRELRRSRFTALWMIANLAAAAVATFALTPIIDEQIAAGDIEIAEGFHGLARATALTLVLFGTFVTYLVLRLGAVLIGRSLRVHDQPKSVTLAPVMVRGIDVGHLALTCLVAAGLPQLLPHGLGVWVLLAVVAIIVALLWLWHPTLRHAPSRGYTALYLAAVAVPVIGVALTQIARW